MNNLPNSAGRSDIESWKKWAQKAGSKPSKLATGLQQTNWETIAPLSPNERSPYSSCNSCKRRRY
jgi:hypothetical protein